MHGFLVVLRMCRYLVFSHVLCGVYDTDGLSLGSTSYWIEQHLLHYCQHAWNRYCMMALIGACLLVDPLYVMSHVSRVIRLSEVHAWQVYLISCSHMVLAVRMCGICLFVKAGCFSAL